MLQKPKSVKLRALRSPRKFGVAGRSCQEVLRKGCLRFQVPAGLGGDGRPGSSLSAVPGCACTRMARSSPKTTSPAFPTTPSWCCSPRARPGRAVSGKDLGDVSDIGRFLSAFHEPHAGLVQAAQQLLCDEQAPQRQRLLADLLHNVSQNIAAETRAEDPPWFEGLESRFQNKSGYLRYSCESRIRSYLREVSSYPSLVGAEAQEEFLRVLSSMCQKLRSVQYNGSYFDRGAKGGGRLCTPEGWFSCQGPFDMDSCLSRHSINPYSNRESRILFSTWNLDHIFPGVPVSCVLDPLILLSSRCACVWAAVSLGLSAVDSIVSPKIQ
ncbi:DNA fragmentation factor subunit beta isoform X3 [Chlorocebus sabaeus]|uniref:DNA fragmentation factor subunit beta isoform X3 n=1 Tax=Chlorocebus sabaeus TaxID=60711 RepID=UPI003BFA18AC